MIWEEANRTADLKAILLESSFPNSEIGVAERSGHLTPRLLKRELAKLNRDDIPVYLVHMKPQYLRELRHEIRGVGHRKITFMEQDKQYRF